MADYWPIAPDLPSSTPSEIEFAHAINNIPKIVFSSSLDKVEWQNSRLVRGSAAEEVLRLKNQPGKDLFVGGLSLAASLADLGLIDEYWLAVQPILLGTGKPLTKGLHNRVDLKLLEIKPFQSGVVALHYQAKS
jgi:dihydrofolate reductase